MSSNPREFIGANNPPPDEGDIDVIDARLIYDAASYIKFRFGDLEELLIKRKGKRPMGMRHVLVYALRGIVPSESMARILKINRKTMGENQQRPEVWANHDSDEGRRFDAILEHVSQAVYHHVSVEPVEFEELLSHWVEKDPELRELEKQRKRHELAAREAERAAQKLDEQKRVRSAKAHAAMLKARGYKAAAAVAGEHMGPSLLASRLTAGALAVIEKLGAARLKDEHSRVLTSALHKQGLAECIDFDLAEIAEPTGARVADPRIRILPAGLRVYEEALGQGLVSKPKRGRDV